MNGGDVPADEITERRLKIVDRDGRDLRDGQLDAISCQFGERVLAVVLTGMGADGTEGASWVKAQGGRVFTEAEETSVVYGMPRSVVEAGLSDALIPLPEMAQAIIEAV